ncbi:MAG TPA: hypothetical protein VGF52_06395 [Tepidisphaeraceae bacterium]|jgi:hypothetical protein
MLLQTNSYHVPKEKRSEHARLLARFRQTLARLGCDHFEAYEQVGANWAGGESTGRFVQIMRFRDRKHQQAVQAAEKSDPAAQTLIKEFCDLIEFPHQQQEGQFAVGFYSSVLAVTPLRMPPNGSEPMGVEEVEPVEHVEQVEDLAHDSPSPLPAESDNGDEPELNADDLAPPTDLPSPDPSIHHS